MSVNRRVYFAAGNYIHRVDDAVYVNVGEAIVYFADGGLVAMAVKNVLYRANDLIRGINYKRQRAVRAHHPNSIMREVTLDELTTMVDAAIMALASSLVDRALR